MSGGDIGARDAKLSIMVGGDKVEHVGGLGRARIGTERAKFSFEKVTPLFQVCFPLLS